MLFIQKRAQVKSIRQMMNARSPVFGHTTMDHQNMLYLQNIRKGFDNVPHQMLRFKIIFEQIGLELD